MIFINQQAYREYCDDYGLGLSQAGNVYDADKFVLLKNGRRL